jgi:hypothetical protein
MGSGEKNTKKRQKAASRERVGSVAEDPVIQKSPE